MALSLENGAGRTKHYRQVVDEKVELLRRLAQRNKKLLHSCYHLNPFHPLRAYENQLLNSQCSDAAGRL